MSPRLTGVRERRDHAVYDTHHLKPNWSTRFFGNDNVGDQFRTNMVIGHQFMQEQTFVLNAIGTRCVGKTRAEEDLLLDHVHLLFSMGDKPYLELLGPQASTLRHVFREDELPRAEKQADEPPINWHEFVAFAQAKGYDKPIFERRDAVVAQAWLLAYGHEPPFMMGTPKPTFRVGYHLARPIVIPGRQSFEVRVDTSPDLPEPINLRIHLFGLQTRDKV